MINRFGEETQFELFDHMPLGIFVVQDDYRVVFWNSTMETWTGIPREHIIGTNLGMAFPNLLTQRYLGRLQNIFAGGPPVIFSSQLHKHLLPAPLPDGTLRIQHTTVTAVKTGDDKNCALFTVEDVTSLTRRIQEYTKLHEQTLKEIAERKNLEAQLHQSQKMEAIGQLAGGVAHDLNNYLTAIFGYTDLALLHIEPGNKICMYVQQVKNTAERAAELVKGLLAFSRKQVLAIKPVSLNEVLHGVADLLRVLVHKNIRLIMPDHKGNLIAMADKSQIEQVIMNLATNARDAMPQGGVLTIKTAPVKIDEHFVQTHSVGAPGSYACISVSDTGIGMDEETQKKIFEPFFTTKEVGKGTGLGLAVAYGIIKQHNGHIDVHSSKGAGTTFEIYLPLCIEEVSCENAAMVQTPFPAGAGTVLLAGDDSIVRELNCIILSEAGYRVIEAVDGQDALEKFYEQRDKVDVLVFDMVMPRIDGKSAYEEIRKIRPDIKVLFISGSPNDFMLSKDIDEDEFTVLLKPLIATEFLQRLQDLLKPRHGTC